MATSWSAVPLLFPLARCFVPDFADPLGLHVAFVLDHCRCRDHNAWRRSGTRELLRGCGRWNRECACGSGLGGGLLRKDPPTPTSILILAKRCKTLPLGRLHANTLSPGSHNDPLMSRYYFTGHISRLRLREVMHLAQGHPDAEGHRQNPFWVAGPQSSHSPLPKSLIRLQPSPRVLWSVRETTC